MKKFFFFVSFSLYVFSACTSGQKKTDPEPPVPSDSVTTPAKTAVIPHRPEIRLEKKLAYDRHTLADEYPYRDTTRRFQWDKIRRRVVFLDSIQHVAPARWAVLQNYKNRNGEAPLVRNYRRDAYKRIADTLGIERYQSVPLYLPGDTSVAERYGRDGELVRFLGDGTRFYRVATVYTPGEWEVPKRYVTQIDDTVVFRKAVFIDRTNQNIATLEAANDSVWLIRSMNPATTGLHRPPYAQETPLGIFVIQEKKARMVYLVDGSARTGGFAPYASRFTDGGYIHGVPVNAPRQTLIEFSPTLGTTPRSHMCVRNATSHAEFIYNWAPAKETIVFVFD